MTQQEAEARAEAMGYRDREADEQRDSNPYRQLTPMDELESRVIEVLVAAWWRGWDEADAVLRRGNLQSRSRNGAGG